MKIEKLDENIKFFGKLSKIYDSWFIQSWMRRFYKPVIYEIKPGKKVLDVSCGTGELLSKLKGELYGTDVSEDMLNVARKKLPKDVKLQKADVHKLPFKNDYFDYVISTESFHHYYDQRKAIKEIVRVCKINGKVIIVDINFFFDIKHRIFEKIEPGCVRINNKKEMQILFENVGLKEIKQKRTFIFAVMTEGVKPMQSKLL